MKTTLTAVLTALALVVFTDLAFGWSTTLDLDAASLHRVVEALSTPWRELIPAARPSSTAARPSWIGPSVTVRRCATCASSTT